MTKLQHETLPYEPPVLRRIELRTEEVLGFGCKQATTNGPGAYPHDSLCILACNQEGS